MQDRASSAWSFRSKLALLSTGAVLLTLIFVLVPLYASSEEELADAHGRRLLAIARTTAAMIPAESLDVIATHDGRTGSAFVFGRSLLSKLWAANGGNVSELANGLAIVRREGPRYRYLVHSSWRAGQPQYNQRWLPPAEVADSLALDRAVFSRLFVTRCGRPFVRRKIDSLRCLDASLHRIHSPHNSRGRGRAKKCFPSSAPF